MNQTRVPIIAYNFGFIFLPCRLEGERWQCLGLSLPPLLADPVFLLEEPLRIQARMSRKEKKERGWKVSRKWTGKFNEDKDDLSEVKQKDLVIQVPDPSQSKGRIAKAVELFLVNLTRPVDQRHLVNTALRMQQSFPPLPADTKEIIFSLNISTFYHHKEENEGLISKVL